jgi:hypothetical protein
MFFVEYINFKIFLYLRRCGVIPVQSFGSHIRPKPSGLGLIVSPVGLIPSPSSFKAFLLVTTLLQIFRSTYNFHK